MTPSYLIQWLLTSFCKISHRSPWDQAYGGQTPAAVQCSANPSCATPSSEENLYLFLKGMIFYNAVKASVHGDMATECQLKDTGASKNLTSEYIPSLSKPHGYVMLTVPESPMKMSGFFFRNTTYIC